MDRLIAIRVFADVAQTGSFTSSADRLEMSRAMVTRYVAQMEQWLGARLLQRTTRRVTLTHAGEQCLRRCLQMLELVQEAEEEVAPDDGELREQLRLTSAISFSHAYLAPVIADFLKLHPRLKIDLDVDDRAVNLVEARVDLAIRITNEPDPGLVTRLLGQCESVLAAAPVYLDEHGMPQHPSELARHQCLGYSNFGKSVWKLTNVGDTQQVDVKTRFTTNEATVLMQAAIAGAGIALLPTYLANTRLANQELRQVLPTWQPPTLSIYALYTSRRRLAPAVRALLDYLIERFAQPLW